MKNWSRVVASLTAILLITTTASAQRAPATIEDLWKLIKTQQNEIDALRAEVRQARQDVQQVNRKVTTTEAQLEATGEYVESLSVLRPDSGGVSMGGYGELHYNRVDTDKGYSDEVDFHRFVLFFGHDFSDRVRFFSELELEHSFSGDAAPGEVELEQAYVEFALTHKLSARTGLFLLPVGILNETHEPPSFYGVERNDVEHIVLPLYPGGRPARP